MAMVEDAAVRLYREAQERAAADERAREANVRRFVEMWLSLGPDVVRAAGSSHRLELDEALGIATSRWARLFDLEAQIPRDEARLAVLARGRVGDPTDEYTSPEVLAKKDAEHRARVEGERAAIEQMKEQAARERTELESYTAKSRR